jgi:hypothetical protein
MSLAVLVLGLALLPQAAFSVDDEDEEEKISLDDLLDFFGDGFCQSTTPITKQNTRVEVML